MTVSSSSAIAMERVPAGLGRRIKALLLTALLVVVTLGVGWLVWSVVEWRRGRTASFRLTDLRVVRRSDGRPIGLARSLRRTRNTSPKSILYPFKACGPDLAARWISERKTKENCV